MGSELVCAQFIWIIPKQLLAQKLLIVSCARACVLFIVKLKLRLKHRWEIPTQIPAVSAADGCDHFRIVLS